MTSRGVVGHGRPPRPPPSAAGDRVGDAGDRGGAGARPFSWPVRGPVGAYMPWTPSQRNGSGSHLRTLRPTQGRAVRLGVPPEDRSRRVRPARLVVATPCRRSRPPSRGRWRSRVHGGAPVARHAEHARPGVRRPRTPARRGRSRCRIRRALDGRLLGARRRCRCASRSGTGRRGRRARSGRRRCAGRTCRRAPCRRASRAPSQPIASHSVGGQRLGDDHRAVHGQPGALLALQGGGEALGAAQDVGGADRAVRRHRVLGADLGDRRLLVDRRRPSASTAAARPRPASPGCIRAPCGRPGRADRARDPDPLGRPRRAEQLAVLARPRTERSCAWKAFSRGRWAGVVGDVERRRPCGRRRRCPPRRRPAMTSSTVSYIARCSRTAASRPCSLAYRSRARRAVVQPAAVAPGGAVAGELLLQDGDPQEGLGLLQVVRGPQAGVAAADDRHVGLGGRRAGPGGDGYADRPVPEGHPPVLEPGGTGRGRGGPRVRHPPSPSAGPSR